MGEPPLNVHDNAHTADYVVRSGIAGGIAGCAAKTLIAPLDRVKILFQTGQPEFARFAGTTLGLPRATKYIWRTEGPLGLFRGHSATLARIFPYAAIKFVAYEQFRAWLIPNRYTETHIRRFLAGSLAGISSVICTYPLDVIRVRLAYTGSLPEIRRDPHRLIHTIIEMWKSEGGFMNKLKAFYPGFGPTFLGVIPYAGVSFFAHDLGHDIFRSKLLAPISVNSGKLKTESDRRRAPLKSWAELVAGGTSGIVAQTASYPLELVRRRMQVGALQKAKLSLKQTVKTIYKESGIRGFFIGLTIGYIKVAPMSACSFYAYEQMKFILEI